MSKNIFHVSGDTITIFREGWNRVATATIREDYLEEIQSVTWCENNGYLQSTLGTLHSYIIKKWYTEHEYRKMIDSGFIVEHMDNNGFNCKIENLCFLPYSENIAKGHTLDRYTQDKRFIALNLFKDFSTQLYQISISFNYPAKFICENIDNAVIDLAFLLYNESYEMVINDARRIMLEYSQYKTFTPSKLSFLDYQLEGEYREQPPLDLYEKYINGGHGHAVVFIEKKNMLNNWTIDNPKKACYFRGHQRAKVQP